jgi:hypothetical protein
MAARKAGGEADMCAVARGTLGAVACRGGGPTLCDGGG